MPRSYAVPEGTTEKLREALKRAKTADELRRVQCVWMRVALGMNSRQICKAVGWSDAYVRVVQSDFLREGTAALQNRKRGGRRYQLMTREAEQALLYRIRAAAWPVGVLEFRDVHQAVEREVGRPVAPSTVHRMLTRHGWARRSLVAIARHGKANDAHFDARRRSGEWQSLRPESSETTRPENP
jgi:transposase